jgi:uncharacterized protein (TIGR03382 family)
MTNQKLLMFAVAGLLVPTAYEGIASAEVHGSAVSVAVPEPVNDTAPVTGNPPRLRRTDQEQPGNEMAAIALFGDGKNGLYFSMTTELNGTRAPNNIQLSLTPFALTQDAATGQVSAVANTTAAKFVTNNNGNERRNANTPTANTINGGNVICAKYNYQPNGTNDTVRYIQCFNAAGQTVLKQTAAYAKNNDDCSMEQDGQAGQVVSYNATTGVTKLVDWGGCNGNGADDGYLWVTQVTCPANPTLPTDCKFANLFDVSLAQREERSRGSCSVDAADTSYTVCTWTEGNNQPQRDGVWMAAVDLSTNAKGANQQQTILWKTQIAGRIDNNPVAANAQNPNGRRTYAQRAIQERIMAPDPKTGALVASNKLIFGWGDAAGNNNTNEGKGGTYYTNMVAVYQVARAKADVKVLAKPVDLGPKLIGLGRTHLGAAPALFGTVGSLTPGLIFLNGSHTGGGANASIYSVGMDPNTFQFSNLGSTPIAPHDRHLYSNYLGNNPGNQGRNHSAMVTVPNPFPQGAGQDAYLLLTATSGKTMASTCTGCKDTVNKPQIKLTGLITVTGIAQTASAQPGNTGSNGSGSNTGSNTGSNGTGDNSNDPGTTLGGCSAGGASSGFAMFLLIGLAAFLRRRR